MPPSWVIFTLSQSARLYLVLALTRKSQFGAEKQLCELVCFATYLPD